MAMHYSFKKWYKDIMEWIMLTEIPPEKQAFAIKTQLKGMAYELIDRMPPDDLIVGGIGLDGNFKLPVALIMDSLRRHYGHLDEESRILPMMKLLDF